MPTNILENSDLNLSQKMLLESYRTEPCRFAECGEVDDLFDYCDDVLDDCDELEDNIEYTVEMVPVIGLNGKCLVEMENLTKYMESAEIPDYITAIRMIAEHNSLDPDTMAVVIESQDRMDTFIKESRAAIAFDKARLSVIKGALGVVKEMKESGITLVKRVYKDTVRAEVKENAIESVLSKGNRNLTKLVETGIEMDDVMDDIDSLSEPITYMDEMVPVIKYGGNCLIEMSDLEKYMETNDITDYAEAVENIARVNRLNVSEMAVLVESQDYFEIAIHEAKKTHKALPKKMIGIEKVLKAISSVKDKGIKVVKRKAKVKSGRVKTKKKKRK